MDKNALYALMDMDGPEEFEYYENMAAFLEADEDIDIDTISEAVDELDKKKMAEFLDSYFDEFMKVVPDDLTDLYLAVDTARRNIMSSIAEHMDVDEIYELAKQLAHFRKWYVEDMNVIDNSTGEEMNVRDARYNLSASRYTGEKCDYDFSRAAAYDDSYIVKVSDLVEKG
jgi:hypothetical protein